ncbi:MAG: glutamate-1-semialdehyde 2,1-aminomutase [Bacteroidales bacterium]
MILNRSKEAFDKARMSIPGGVNSPARAFKSVGHTPLFIERASGARITDIDGNEFIDYVGSWGPMILGHSHPQVIAAIEEISKKGTSFGAPTLIETQMAELIKEMVPGTDMVRMVNSGTEATMSALRLARGYTGKTLIVKFEGCYHGHSDSFLIRAGSGALTHGSPDSPGVTRGTAEDTLTAEFNNLSSVEKIFNEKGGEIAAVIVEPVPGNMGVIKPKKEFLEGLRDICSKHGALLVFDEVMSGFRLAPGGAQELTGVSPDLSTFGKIIGGGLPVGAFAGKKEIMEMLAPQGAVYQAGTLSGNPVAMMAGYTTLSILKKDPDHYRQLEKKSFLLEEGFKDNIRKTGVPAVVNRVGSMLTLFFTGREEVSTFSDVMTCDTGRFAAYFRKYLEKGIYLPPSQFESLFVSLAHTEEELMYTVEKNYEVLKSL